MKQLLLIPGFLLVVLSSCNIVGNKRIRGNGIIKTEAREEHGFQSIEVSGAIKVYVKQDSAYSVNVETDENLQQYIEVYTNKNSLIVKQKNGYNLKSSKPVKVYVSGPSFRYLEISGASSINSENRLSPAEEIFIDVSGASTADVDVKSPMVKIELSGASNASLSGEVKDININASGASHANCFELLAENAYVEASGASEIKVFASVKLDAHSSGASDVKYKGSAAVTQEVSGAASVKKEE